MSNKSVDLSPEIKDPRFDLPVLALGSLISAALSVGLATALLYLSRTNIGADVGPTAATLNDAFSTLFGAALGLLAGDRRLRSSAGPDRYRHGPERRQRGESFGFALLLGIPLGLSVLIGSMAGAGVGARVHDDHP